MTLEDSEFRGARKSRSYRQFKGLQLVVLITYPAMGYR